jgi:hypothetical protein
MVNIFLVGMSKFLGYHALLVNNNPTKIKFLVSINKYQAEVIITLNEMLECISKDEKTDTMGNFYQKKFHQGPMQPISHPENNGS